MKKHIYKTAALLMALMLCGCDNFSVTSNSGISYQSSADIEESSDNSDSEPKTTDTGATTSEITSETEEISENTFVLNYDPLNMKTLTFEDGKIIFSGKFGDLGTDSVGFSGGADIDITTDDDSFTAVITPKWGCGRYENVTYTNSGGMTTGYRVGYKDGEFYLPYSPEIAESNTTKAEEALIQPLEQVSEYVTEGSDPEKIRSVLEQVKELSDTICAGLDNDYDKLRAISRWVSQNIYYDFKAWNEGVPPRTLTLEYILEEHSGVCGSYSNITAALCAAQGIKCYNVHGMVVQLECYEGTDEEEIHEWNFAVIDDRIIWVDSGWNSYCYRDEDGSLETNPIGSRYFDIDGKVLALNHRVKYCEYRDYFALLNE